MTSPRPFKRCRLTMEKQFTIKECLQQRTRKSQMSCFCPVAPTQYMAMAIAEAGIVHFQEGEHHKAMGCFSRALMEGDFIKSFTSTETHDSTLDLATRPEAKEYDEGMNFFTSVLTLSDLSSPTAITATLLYNVAQSHTKLGQVQAATSMFQRALGFCDARSCQVDQTSPLRVRILLGLGHCSFRKNQRQQAMTYFQQALSMMTAQPIIGRSGPLAAVLNCVGVLSMSQTGTNLQEVLAIFKQSLELFQQNDKYPREVATVMNNIGRAYSLKREYSNALIAFQDALKVRRAVLGNDSDDVAACLFNIGQAYQHMKEFDQALKFLEEYKEIISSSIRDEPSPLNCGELGMVYNCMGDTYTEEGNQEMAMKHHKLALKWYATASMNSEGASNADIATTLNKLGKLSYDQKDLESALKYYQEGLALERVVYSQHQQHVVTTLKNIAHIHKTMRNYEDSLRVQKEILQIEVTLFGPQCFDVSSTLASIGLMQYHLGDYEDAFDSYQSTLRILRQTLQTEDNADIASTLNSLGLVLFRMNRMELARECFVQCSEIRSRVLGTAHREVAYTLHNIGAICLETGDDDGAIVMFERALGIERRALGKDHPDTVSTLQHLGWVQLQMGELDKAKEYLQEATEIERASHIAKTSSNKDMLVKLLTMLGNVSLQQGNSSEMVEYLAEASRILGEENPEGISPLHALRLGGSHFYCWSKVFPPCAPVA